MNNMSKKMVALALAAIMIGCAGCSAQNEQTENTATVIEESIASESNTSSEMSSDAVSESSEINMENESSEADVQTEDLSASDFETQSLEDILSSTIGAYTETDRSAIYETSEDGEHAIEVDGETAVYEGILVTKTGSSDGEDADFYGENADRKSTRLNSSHTDSSRMPSSA